MRKLAFALLLAFVFTLPWEEAVVLPLLGTPSRIFAMLSFGVGVLAVAAQRHEREPGVLLWLATAFVFCNALTLLWTVDVDATVERVLTYAQLLPIVWLVWELARGQKEHDALMAAFCGGVAIAMVSQFVNFRDGLQAVAGATPLEARYAVTNADPNDFGFTLALSIPMAWYLFTTHRGIARWFAATLVPVALVGILLTSSRGALLGGIVAISVVVFVGRASALTRSAGFAALILIVGAGALVVVPAAAWSRLMTVGTELQGGTMSGRTVIWATGFDVFTQNPLLGVGAGAFSTAVEAIIGGKAPHNALLAIAVEQGVVGLVIFLAVLVVCAWQIIHFPRQDRACWALIGLIWLTASMSLNWQSTKNTWLLMALIAVRGALVAENHRVPARERTVVAPSSLQLARHPRGSRQYF